MTDPPAAEQGRAAFAKALPLRIAALSAIVIFINTSAYRAYCRSLVSNFPLSDSGYATLSFFDEFIVVYSIIVCCIFIFVPGRVVSRFVHIWDPSTWRSGRAVAVRLVGIGIWALMFFIVMPNLVGKWLELQQYLDFLVVNSRPIKLAGVKRALQSSHESTSVLGNVSFLVLNSSLLGVLAWIGAWYYRVKQKPLFEWKRYHLGAIEFLSHLILPLGGLLVISVLVIQVPNAYGTARGSQRRAELMGSPRPSLRLVLQHESPYLRDVETGCGPSHRGEPRVYCYGESASSLSYLYVALESEDYIRVVKVHHNTVSGVVDLPRAVVLEIDRWK